MLGDDSLTCFLPRLSLETQKSSLSQKLSDHTLSAATPPRGLPGTSWEVAALAWLLGKEQEGWVTWWKIPAGEDEGALQRSAPPPHASSSAQGEELRSMLPRGFKGGAQVLI